MIAVPRQEGSAAPFGALFAEVVGAARPARTLGEVLRRIEASGDARLAEVGLRVFEATWPLLPPFEDDAVPSAAAALYLRRDLLGGAFLMAAHAAQMQGGGPLAARVLDGYFRRVGRLDEAVVAARRFGLPAPDDAPEAAKPGELAQQAARIAAAPGAGSLLLHALEQHEDARDLSGALALFESVWFRAAPMADYWVYHRMARIYAALGRTLASALMAGLAIQMEAANVVADMPYRQMMAWYRANERAPEAALLLRRREALCPEPALVSPEERAALLLAAGDLPRMPPPAWRRDTEVVAAESRPPTRGRAYGGEMAGLRQLGEPMLRPPIAVAELRGAEVLIDGLAVAVFAADGQPQVDLSTREYPGMVRRRLDDARQYAGGVEEISLDAAMLLTDLYAVANLCHFLLDQAPRLELYRRVGADFAITTAIGPMFQAPYQYEVAARMGVRHYLAVGRRARVRVDRLLVSSNCSNLRHPAHWGAAWALDAVRAAFDLRPSGAARRLLVSRADSRYRRIANEAEIEAMLAPVGFQTIVPGRMEFLDQVAAFRDATHVIAPHGAALANTLFCAPGTQVLEVFHPRYATWAYAMIAPTLGLRYASLRARDGESDDPRTNDPELPQLRPNEFGDRDMRVDPDLLRAWLKESGAC